MSPARSLALAAALAFAGLGALTGRGAWFAAALPLAAWALAGSFVPAPRIALRAERSAAEDSFDSGRAIDFSVSVRNEGERLEWLRLSDELPPGSVVVSGEPTWKGSLEAGGVAEIRYRAALPRGEWTFRSLRASVLDPLLDLRAEAEVECPLSVAVLPAPLEAPTAGFAAGAVRPFAGLSLALRPGGGTAFSSTRDYAPGDPVRNLNRHAERLWGRAVVNVREEERAIDAGVILDSRASAYPDEALFEATVAAALALAEHLLDQGCRTAFMSSGAGIAWVPPGLGREQRYRIRRAAAAARLGDHATFERFDALPTRVFPSRSLVVVASPLLERDLHPLRDFVGRGYSVAVLRPDPLAPARGTPPPDEDERVARRLETAEARQLVSRLLASGVSVLDWNPARPLATTRLRSGASR